MKDQNSNSRRNFIGKIALGSTIGGLAGLANPAVGNTTKDSEISLHEADEWFKNIKGTHRVVYDGSTPHDGFAIIWNWVFYLTNNQTDSPDSDITAMTVLRHSGVGFALEDWVWAKYKLGEALDVKDPATGNPSLRNPYYDPKPGDFPMPQIQGIKDLIGRGAMFCVCDLALQVNSAGIAAKMNMKTEDVYADMVKGVLPGVNRVPSGVWALGRAQEHGCAYIFAGG
ncbi:Tat (twin-arginine translocation) pathway signal sequence containing protein [Algoriphagus yeomjeoni]|uniref:Tat (twin-arginine translocation) pathway signal sequence containing protein n=1 Tax=Algoriphagus yeomjeoni TaxID=291403 RepID=UPI003CE53C9E